MPNSSQRPPQDCVKCGNPVESPSCQGCALWRKKLKEVWFTICHGIYQDLLNTSESSDDDTNVVNAPREPFVMESFVNNALVANLSTYPSRHFNSFCYDDDDDEEYIIAITPEEPADSLIIDDEHLDTILKTESDEFIKSSVENLVPTPSESEDFSGDECVCDVPDCDDSQTTNFSTFSNPLFDDSTSSDDESSHGEVIHEISFKTYSNPLFDLDEEIISSEFNSIHNEDLNSTPKDVHFDAESYLLESSVNHDTLMTSSPKNDSILDEFAGELKTIPPGIVNTDHEEYISLMERLLYGNSSPRPPENFHAIPNTIIESLPTFSIPVEDSDSLREEIDIFPGPDDSIPPGIESDDYDSEGDDNSTSLPEFESFHVDYPDSGDSTIDVVEDIPVDVPNILAPPPPPHMDFDFIPSHNDLGSDLDVSPPSGDRNKIYDPGICIEVESTRFLATLSPVIDTLLPFSSENKDKVFNHGVLASKEKSPPSSSHRGFKASKLFHHKSPMLIYGEDIPILDVPIAPDFEASRAHGFVLRSLELQSFA
ncbi:hypothetical protein Tco_1113564 [Tanacetum coccineum]|uniref:Uncharacterized protein n=1 Tax=Tanacetum coccineum TaxID=301880 RepID=A0ABQ5IT39_9ASTR